MRLSNVYTKQLNNHNEDNRRVPTYDCLRHHYWPAYPLLPVLSLLLSKINDPDAYTYHIVIYGDNIDATMLAYYIDAGIKAEFSDYRNVVTFNITLVSAPQTDDEPDAEEKRNKIIDKRIFSFCGVEREWMALLDNTNLKYNIKEYGIYFGETI